MNRTFEHRIMLQEWLAIVLFAGASLYCLLHRESFLLVGMGICFGIATFVSIFRVIGSAYTITTDGKLIIDHGRFHRKKTIPIDRIERLEELPLAFSLGSYVLLHLKSGKVISLQPYNREGFIAEIEKRI